MAPGDASAPPRGPRIAASFAERQPAGDAPAAGQPLRWPSFCLGLALGGFFDGILLHQILQWHHLLSNVEAVRDMRLQILADGLFHALMYVIAAVSLLVLWRRRASLAGPGTGLRLWGDALMGFGAWHIVDAIASHWVTGIHRIRVDSPDPLMWDLLWFFVFGLVPVLAGWFVRRRGGGDTSGSEGPGHGRGAAVSLALAALIAGPVAALPAAGSSGQAMVVFAPGVSAATALDALGRADARVLWADRSGGVWAVRLKHSAAARQLYREGALLVTGSALAFGCVSWTRWAGAKA